MIVRSVTRGQTRESLFSSGYYLPMSLCVQWEQSPGNALRRTHAMSEKLGFLAELWMQAFCKSLQSQLLTGPGVHDIYPNETWCQRPP